MGSDGSAAKDVGLGDTKQKIMNLLLGGPRTAAEVAEKLEIQKSAARTTLNRFRQDTS